MAQEKQVNSFQIAGKLLEIHMPQRISEKTTKRSFTMEVWTGTYSNPVLFDLINERAKQLDGLKPGEWVIATFELKGRKIVRDNEVNVRYYNNLNCLTVIKG